MIGFPNYQERKKEKKKRTMFRMLSSDQLNHFETNQGMNKKIFKTHL